MLDKTLEIFNDNTGRTQGIKFKINPPINAISNINKILSELVAKIDGVERELEAAKTLSMMKRS